MRENLSNFSIGKKYRRNNDIGIYENSQRVFLNSLIYATTLSSVQHANSRSADAIYTNLFTGSINNHL